MSERSHDAPKGCKVTPGWFMNMLPIEVKIGPVHIKARLEAHYNRDGEYQVQHDGIMGGGATLNWAAWDWVRNCIARDIERS